MLCLQPKERRAVLVAHGRWETRRRIVPQISERAGLQLLASDIWPQGCERTDFCCFPVGATVLREAPGHSCSGECSPHLTNGETEAQKLGVLAHTRWARNTSLPPLLLTARDCVLGSAEGFVQRLRWHMGGGAEGALAVFHCSGSETTLNHWGSRNRATPMWWPQALSRPGIPTDSTEKGRQ